MWILFPLIFLNLSLALFLPTLPLYLSLSLSLSFFLFTLFLFRYLSFFSLFLCLTIFLSWSSSFDLSFFLFFTVESKSLHCVLQRGKWRNNPTTACLLRRKEERERKCSHHSKAKGNQINKRL